MCNPSLGSCKEKKMFVNLCNASLQHFCFLKETKTNGRLSAKKWKRRNVPVIKRQTWTVFKWARKSKLAVIFVATQCGQQIEFPRGLFIQSVRINVDARKAYTDLYHYHSHRASTSCYDTTLLHPMSIPVQYSEVQCTMGNVHMPPPQTEWRTDTTESITFPQFRWQAVIKTSHRNDCTPATSNVDVM